MPAVHLKIEKHRAVLTLESDDGKVIESEVWVFPTAMPKGEAKGTARAVFDDAYDFLNFCVHGNPGPG